MTDQAERARFETFARESWGCGERDFVLDAAGKYRREIMQAAFESRVDAVRAERERLAKWLRVEADKRLPPVDEILYVLADEIDNREERP